MGGIVAQEFKAVRRVPGDDLDSGVGFDIAGEVPQIPVDAYRNGVTRQALADRGGDVQAGHYVFELTLGTVR